MRIYLLESTIMEEDADKEKHKGDHFFSYKTFALFILAVGVYSLCKYMIIGSSRFSVSFIVPGGIFFLIFCAIDEKRWSVFLSYVKILALFCVGGLVLILIYTYQFYNQTKDITSVGQYESVLQNRWPKSLDYLVVHFPPKPPESASDIRFFFRPAFLQGGSILQLSLALPPDEIAKLNAEYEPMATQIFSCDSQNAQGTKPPIDFYTSSNGNKVFSDDYRIMCFDPIAPGSKHSSPFSGNHGNVHGVAISIKASQIVYWAEYW